MQEIKKDLNIKPKKDNLSSHYENLLNVRKSALNTKEKNTAFKWLTEHSRKFLSAGYVKKGTTAENRIREISVG